jgi:hypothetical protein
MTTTSKCTRALTCLLVASYLAGCAAPRQGGQGAANDNQDPCSGLRSAGLGAVLGAALGAAANGKKGAMQGAALGAAVGAVACLVINVQSRQTKTAAQVDRDYQQARGPLPSEPALLSYAPQLSSRNVQRGQPFKVTSVVELTNGSVHQVREVREELIILNPDNTPFRSGNKPFAASSAGRYENSFELKLPEGASQGIYTMTTRLYVNDKLVASRDLRTQVAWDGSSAVLLASR